MDLADEIDKEESRQAKKVAEARARIRKAFMKALNLGGPIYTDAQRHGIEGLAIRLSKGYDSEH